MATSKYEAQEILRAVTGGTNPLQGNLLVFDDDWRFRDLVAADISDFPAVALTGDVGAVQAELDDHEAATDAHGIPNTALLETLAGATAKANAAQAAAIAASDPAGTATAAVGAHNSDTTDVHGITDTSALVLTDDGRLTDARTPTDHASSHYTTDALNVDLIPAPDGLDAGKLYGNASGLVDLSAVGTVDFTGAAFIALASLELGAEISWAGGSQAPVQGLPSGSAVCANLNADVVDGYHANGLGRLEQPNTWDDSQIFSDVASFQSPTLPFVVVGTDQVDNLNAELLGGHDSAFYRDLGNVNAGVLPVAFGGTGSATSSLRTKRLLAAVALVASTPAPGVPLSDFDFPVLAGEIWRFELMVPFVVSAGTAGVAPNWKTPAGTTGHLLLHGTVASASPTYMALTTNTGKVDTNPNGTTGTAFGTTALTGWFKLEATFSFANAGTVSFGLVTGASAAGSALIHGVLRAVRVN